MLRLQRRGRSGSFHGRGSAVRAAVMRERGKQRRDRGRRQQCSALRGGRGIRGIAAGAHRADTEVEAVDL
jgi:hypothetical protein